MAKREKRTSVCAKNSNGASQSLCAAIGSMAATSFWTLHAFGQINKCKGRTAGTRSNKVARCAI
jgi:hypothetical protein